MELKLLTDKPELNLKKNSIYEIDESEPIVVNTYKIKIPGKQKGKFRYALIKDSEGELIA